MTRTIWIENTIWIEENILLKKYNIIMRNPRKLRYRYTNGNLLSTTYESQILQKYYGKKASINLVKKELSFPLFIEQISVDYCHIKDSQNRLLDSSFEKDLSKIGFSIDNRQFDSFKVWHNHLRLKGSISRNKFKLLIAIMSGN